MAVTIITSKWNFKMKHVTDRERLHEIREHLIEDMMNWSAEVYTGMGTSQVTLYVMDVDHTYEIDMELEHKAIYDYLTSVDFIESVEKEAIFRSDEIKVNPRLELVESNQTHYVVRGKDDVTCASL